MTEIASTSEKVIYMIVDREPEGREYIDSVYTDRKLADVRLKEMQKLVKEPHNYYGPHLDSYRENGGVIDCCIDVPQ